MEYIYRFIRRRTRPIPRDKARYWHDKLSVLYYMLGWTAAGLTLIHICTNDPRQIPDELNVHSDPTEQTKSYVKKLADTVRKEEDMQVKVVRMKNFTLQSVESYQTKALNEKVAATVQREKEDFFGGSEDEAEKELLM